MSLRRIAERLGAKAPSLARHVGDKGQLVALLSAAIFGDALDSIPGGLSGDGWLEAFGHALRTKQAETRDIAALLSIVPPNPEVHDTINRRLRSLMREAGLEGPRAQTPPYRYDLYGVTNHFGTLSSGHCKRYRIIRVVSLS